MNVSNVMNNVRALLSSGQRRPDNAEVVDDGETGREISAHGSGSRPDFGGLTPSRVGQTMLQYDDADLEALDDDEFNARIEQSQAALATLKRPSRRSTSSERSREFNPMSSGELLRTAESDRTVRYERKVPAANWDASHAEKPETRFARGEPTSEKKYMAGRAAAGPESPMEVKNLVKIETLLKEFKTKLSSSANFSSWLVEMKSIGNFRRWPDGLLDDHNERDLNSINYGDYSRAREEAFLALRSTVSSEIMYLFASVKFGHVEEAMKILRDKFCAVTVLQKRTALREFGQMTMETTGLDVDSFVAAIKLEAGKIRDLGLPVTEVDMSSILITGLLHDEDFKIIKSQLSDDRDLGDFDYIVSKISNFAKNAGISSRKVKVKKVDGLALYASSNSNDRKSICKTYKETGKCSYGSKCRFKHGKEKSKDDDESSKSYDKNCYACGKSGHWAKECPRADKKASQKSPKRLAASIKQEKDEEDSDDEDKGHALPMVLSAALGKGRDDVFGIDSFASSHLTNDRNDFIPGSVRAVKMVFQIGSGSTITVLEEGDIKISQGKNGEVVKLMKVGFFPNLPFKLISGGRLFQAGFQIEHGNEDGKLMITKKGVKIFSAVVKENVLVIEGIRILSKKKGSLAILQTNGDHPPAYPSDEKPVKVTQSLDPSRVDVPAGKVFEIKLLSLNGKTL